MRKIRREKAYRRVKQTVKLMQHYATTGVPGWLADRHRQDVDRMDRLAAQEDAEVAGLPLKK